MAKLVCRNATWRMQGFSLIELLVAIAIAGIVSAAIFTTFFSQNKVYVEQEQVVAMQQNLRAGFDLMIREIRMAGFVGEGQGDAGFLTAGPATIEFTLDANENDNVTDDGENLTYSLYTDGNGVPCLGRKTTAAGANQAVAEDVVGLGFAYAFVENENDTAAAANDNGTPLDDSDDRMYWGVIKNGTWHDLDVNADGQITLADDTDNDGDLTNNAVDTGITANLDNIRAVRIWLLARTGVESRDFNDTNRYVVGGQVVQPNNGFRHRLLTAVVNCRNLWL